MNHSHLSRGISQNIIRKVFHADYYADPVTGDIGDVTKATIPDHIGHCIDMLRQGVQCAADITFVVAYASGIVSCARLADVYPSLDHLSGIGVKRGSAHW